MAVVRAHITLNEQALNEQARSYGRRRLASIQRRTATQARVDVPVKTGNLGRTIQEEPIRFVGPRSVSGGVTAGKPVAAGSLGAPYAAAVHEGRRARVIRPRHAKALRFEIGGRVVYATVVRQGPMRGRPFLRNAAYRIAAQETATH